MSTPEGLCTKCSATQYCDEHAPMSRDAAPKKQGIVFGALAPKLHEQLPISRRKLRYLQECADGIVHLVVGGMLTDAEARRARLRLLKRIHVTFRQELSR